MVSPAPRELDPRERRHVVAAACLGWLFGAMDVVLLLFLREQVAAGLGVGPAWLDGAISAGLAFSALGAVLFAQLGDRHGRVAALSWAILLYSLGTAAMALAWDEWSLLTFRAISAVGTGGEWSLGFALVAEVWRADRRGTIGGLVQSMFNVGTLLAVILGMALRAHWRWAFAAAAIPALAVFYIRRRVPESRLWLRLENLRAQGAVPPEMRRPPLAQLFRGRLLRVTVLASLVFTLMNLGFYVFASQVTPFLTAPVEKGGLGWTQAQAGPVYLAMTLAAGLAAVLGGWLSDRVGRRHVFSAFCAVGAVAFVALYFVIRGADPGRPGPLWATIVLGTAAFGINGVVGALFSELYPTHLRATGPGFVSNFGKFLGAGAPLIGGWIIRSAAEPRQGWALGLAAPAACLAVLAVLIWTLPRVTGRRMEPVERDEYLEKAG